MTTDLVKTDNQITKFNFFDPVQFETMQRVCKLFAHSELVPDMYKVSANNPEEKAIANCMIAVEMSTRTGASPLMIMQNMVIIYGRPSWSSKFLVASVNSCGRFNPLQYKFKSLGMLGKIPYVTYEKEWIPGTNGGKGYYKNNAKTMTFDGVNIENIECIAYTTAKGSTEVLESSPITIEMSVKEGWYTKAGSKWPTMTKQMLMYRAASFWTNAYAPEVSMGMATEDEVRDVIDIPYEDVTNKVIDEINARANKETVPSMDETKRENTEHPKTPKQATPRTEEKKPEPGPSF